MSCAARCFLAAPARAVPCAGDSALEALRWGVRAGSDSRVCRKGFVSFEQKRVFLPVLLRLRARPPACTSDMCCLQRFHRTWLNQPSHRGKREEQSKGAGSQTPEMSRFERTTLQVLSVIEFIVPKYKY